ncbi:serine hydrolase domain-containing protein [Amaricoccus tamworthensis]|uniref:serine hydrolase domain-containing protein n=1 Tax=Amaricoccus tamworthensis TaxID=57002 RepID=UPI003C7EBD40
MTPAERIFGRTLAGRALRVLGLLLTAAAGGAVWLVSTLADEATPLSISSDATTLKALIDDWAADGAIPGVILRVDRNGETLYEHASGTLANGSDTPVTPDTPFHTASVGKLFTAAAMLRLSERGLVDLDAPVVSYLGRDSLDSFLNINGRFYGAQVTVRHLLAHRAGFGNTDSDTRFALTVLLNKNKKFTPDELLAIAARVPAVGRPGERMSYASPGYYLAGLVLEKVAGRPYHEVVRAEIFDRLGMGATVEANAEWDRGSDHLHHYAGRIDLSERDPGFEFADGGFVTTAGDMAIFGQAIIDGKLFDEAATARAFTAPWPGDENETFHQAMGPGVKRVGNRPVLISHRGYWGVYFLVYPRSQTVVTLTLAQSRADTNAFWSEARPLIEALDGTDLETGET